MLSSFDPVHYLPDDLLTRIRDRAAEIDRDNRFPDNDLDELRAAGYLRAMLPQQRGGADLSLEQMVQLQRRLAGAAPATALAVNMHVVWMAVSRTLRAQGFDTAAEIERRIADDEVLAFGISEPGNDQVLFDSTTVAVPDGHGGYHFTGTKIFTSLSPVWTSLGVHGVDATTQPPQLVFALLHRDTDTITSADDWNTLGMRGTQSQTTHLRHAHAESADVLARLDLGPSLHPLVLAIFAAFEILISSVYVGIAARALDVASNTLTTRISRTTGSPYSANPELRHSVAAAAIELDGATLQVERLAQQIDDLSPYGSRWFSLLSGLKYRTTTAARSIVTAAAGIAGGSSYRSGAELDRLQRDVLAGQFHPSSDASVFTTMAAAVLGPVEQSSP